jgi:hypothetical protein
MFNPRKGKLPRINIELLEPRRLLSGHGWGAPDAMLDSDGHGRGLEHANFEFHGEQHGSFSLQSASLAPSPEAVFPSFPVVVELIQTEPQPLDFRVTLIETVSQNPTPLPSGGQGTLAPQVQRPSRQTLPPAGSDGDNQDGITSQTTSSTGQINDPSTIVGSLDSVEIIIRTDGGKVSAFLLHASENFTQTPGGISDAAEQHPPTLLPGGSTSAPHVQPAPVPAFEPAFPPTGIPEAQPPVTPTAPAAAVTPLAMQPSAATQVTATATSTTPPATNLVTSISSHDSTPAIATAPAEVSFTDSSRAPTHLLGPIAVIAPGMGSQQPGGAISGAVQIAAGAVQPAATILEKAGELIANPLPQDSLPAAVAYNFIRFDAAAFHDAASVFAADLAAMTTGNIEASPSHTRAWLITGAVLGFDAAFLAYWYRRGKREREKQKLLAGQ